MSEPRRTRAQALAAAGALAAGLLLPRRTLAGEPAGDTEVLAFLLSLERLQAGFYTEAERVGALTGAHRDAAADLGATERAHARALAELLGARAPAAQRLDFRGTTESAAAFARTAVALEELAVAAFAGQLPALRSPEALVAVMGIHTAEARHAARVRLLAGEAPAPYALDEPRRSDETLRAVAATRIVSRREPRLHGTRTPDFTR